MPRPLAVEHTAILVARVVNSCFSCYEFTFVASSLSLSPSRSLVHVAGASCAAQNAWQNLQGAACGISAAHRGSKVSLH